MTQNRTAAPKAEVTQRHLDYELPPKPPSSQHCANSPSPLRVPSSSFPAPPQNQQLSISCGVNCFCLGCSKRREKESRGRAEGQAILAGLG